MKKYKKIKNYIEMVNDLKVKKKIIKEMKM